MASGVTVSTPSPPGRVHTPGTPKYGYADSWEPFSPRKSARISSRQQSSNRTPSPRAPKHSSTKHSASFSTPGASPIKKRQPNMDSVRRASGHLTAKSTADAADALQMNTQPPKQTHSAVTASHGTGMLPTPAKTPRKQPNAKTEAASRAIARNLFTADEDAMPSPKKKTKKYTGLSLDSFRAEDAEEDIEIFTDPRDQIPEVDDSAGNPFYGDRPLAEPSKRQTKRKLVLVPGEGRQSIDDAVRRDDGVLVVFRGKKIFRKFSESHDAEFSSQDENDEADELALQGHRPMTRSSIKPRLLFPPKSKGKQTMITSAVEDDEEAMTEIEDNVVDDTQDAKMEAPETPVQVTASEIETPKAPRFAPASPPSTGRATRSTDRLRGVDKAKVPSPFDGWRRSKNRAPSHGQKRGGDSLAKSPTSTKRQRA
ncbi:hypothetical protein F5Y14DRAFT_400114 [Nemania sp. NC0429]|nr:hypothetical protein F5Y14DRAFT_400114 [Nemania sp. NC0429]